MSYAGENGSGSAKILTIPYQIISLQQSDEILILYYCPSLTPDSFDNFGGKSIYIKY